MILDPARVPKDNYSASEVAASEKPPPYRAIQHHTNVPTLPALPPRRPLQHVQPVSPPATPNQIHLQTKGENIKGQFYIDPLTPSLSTQKCKSKKKAELPHASFRTRNGNIQLELATTSNVKGAPQAKVAVATRRGRIQINVLPMPPTRPHIGLDVNSRHGNIYLFVHPTFSGVIQLTTRKGDMRILPALSAIGKVLKTTDKEVLLLVQGENSAPEDAKMGNLCQLTSRSGNLVVGLSGRDELYATGEGVWKKLSALIFGSAQK